MCHTVGRGEGQQLFLHAKIQYNCENTNMAYYRFIIIQVHGLCVSVRLWRYAGGC